MMSSHRKSRDDPRRTAHRWKNNCSGRPVISASLTRIKKSPLKLIGVFPKIMKDAGRERLLVGREGRRETGRLRRYSVQVIT